MEILDLIVKRQWYYFMKAGMKTEEFRRDCTHWRKRLFKHDRIRQFDIIRIRCGYTPIFTDFECRGIVLHEGGISRQYGDVRLEMPGPLFVIKLGGVYEKKVSDM